MIGSAVGGYVDPTQVFGPRLTDVRGQTSAVGGAIPRAWGTAPVPGNIIWQQPGVTEHKHTDDGKGSGTEQITYTYTRSYAIMFHLGEIAGVLQIKRNGKIVYDARDEATLLAEYEEAMGPLSSVEDWTNRIKIQAAMNNRFMSRCVIYNGTQTQEPDPTIESYEGVGNAHAYRGRAYMVVTDDETQAGEIAQYEVVISVCGAVNQEGQAFDQLYLSSNEGTIAGGLTALNTDVSPPVPAGGNEPLIKCLDGKLFYFSVGGHHVKLSEDSDWIEISGVPTGTNDVEDIVKTNAGFIVLVNGDRYVYHSPDGIEPFTEIDCAGDGNTLNASCIMQAGDALCIDFATPAAQDRFSEDGGMTWANGTFRPATNFNPVFASATDGNTVVAVGAYVDFDRVRVSTDGMATWNDVATPATSSLYWAFVASTGGMFLAMDNGGSTVTATNPTGTWSAGPALPTAVAGQSKHNRLHAFGDAFVFADQQSFGGSPATVARYTDGVAAWASIPSTSVAVVGGTSVTSSPSPLGAAPIPDAPGWYVDDFGEVFGPESETITPCATTTVGEIVADVCALSGLTADEIDVSQLTDTLDGYVIARETDAASVIESLRPVGMFDPAEWDGKFRGIKRGGTAVGSINGDDLVERDGDAFEREMVQEAELLRKVSVGYLDTQAAWAPNTQAWERTVGTINARGESVIEVTAVMDADQAATVAKRKGLTAWGEPEKQKFSLPYRLAKYTPTDILNYTDADAEVHPIRLMQIEDDSGIRYIESSLNCAEAYNATATGVAPKAPTITDGSLRGPTKLVAMDLPLWRTTDPDELGMYVAGTGYLGGWTGAQIDVSEDFGSTYTTVAQVTEPAVIGYTTTALTAWVSSEMEEAQEVTVYLPEAPSSVSYDVLLRYANRAAVKNASGEWEILQYQTVTALGDDLYTLSGLVRGRYNTTPGVVNANATFVLLNSAVQFVRAERDSLDQTLTVRATTYGTSSDAAVPFSFNFTAAASQTEWPVTFVTAERDGSDNVTVTWVGVARLGTETSPYHSSHFTGYRVTYSDGETYDVGTTTTTHTRSSAPVSQTITVSPLNDITGAGPPSDPVTI